jgi:transcriptional regulator with XRE-family HTH domain
METIGERLRIARKRKGMTQLALAEQIGVSRGVIFNIENNKTGAQPIVVNAVCRTLEINREWFTDGEGEMAPDPITNRSARLIAELAELTARMSEQELMYLLDMIDVMWRRLGGKNEGA